MTRRSEHRKSLESQVTLLTPALRAAFVATMTEWVSLPLREKGPELRQILASAQETLWEAAAGRHVNRETIRSLQEGLGVFVPADSEDDRDDLLYVIGCLHQALESLDDPTYIEGVLVYIDSHLTGQTRGQVVLSGGPPGGSDGDQIDAALDVHPLIEKHMQQREEVLEYLEGLEHKSIDAQVRRHLIELAPS